MTTKKQTENVVSASQGKNLAASTQKSIRKILVIGSGPIQIGQGCEFDYSGTQACKALREAGFQVVLVNSNPATIMTDPESADSIYIEPLTKEYVESIIEKEKPCAILPTMGGQVALNLFMLLHSEGILAKHGVVSLGVNPRTVELAEDRRLFKELVTGLGYGVVRGGMVKTKTEAVALAAQLRYPLIIRASFTLGGTGGGIAADEPALHELIAAAIEASPNGEIAIEESIVGWKEYELEVMRDSIGTFVVVCGIENLNPMGVHTGDSITVAPCMTLTDREYQNLRNIAKDIFAAIGMETGGANIQFAVHPDTGEVVVIEMNPRVSRSSALVSKATGYPIAKISALLAVGQTLDEIKNEITGVTPAAFEPAIDYVVVKIPRWDLAKFPGANKTLGVQMKSVGEVLAFGRGFKDAFQRAWRSLEQGFEGWPAANGLPSLDVLNTPTPRLCMEIKSAFENGIGVEELHERTHINRWFLVQLLQIWEQEERLKNNSNLSNSELKDALKNGFSRKQIGALTGLGFEAIEAKRLAASITPTFKMVDTCAGEFEAKTPYYFKTWETEDDNRVTLKPKVVILGSGPNRIGQGIEFDYACVHAVKAAQKLGYEAILINCNPETVSTDSQVSDKLYFEPLSAEDVIDVLRAEKPHGVFIQFGGQTPLKIAKAIESAGFNILGSGFSTTELCENRLEFGRILQSLNLKCPSWGTATDVPGAIGIAAEVGYPVLVRPSYVLGGQGMRVAHNPVELEYHMRRAAKISPDHPVLIDKFLEGALEFDVDVLCDGKSAYVPAVLEHVEEAGIHSGDSACLVPPQNVPEKVTAEIIALCKKLALKLGIIGAMNVQCATLNGSVFVLEVNPRCSRTVPFVSKAMNIPVARIAASLCLGKQLSDFQLPPEGSAPTKVCVKAPVFPFRKFPGFAPYTGPEMRSLGEVMGQGDSAAEALYKAYLSAGLKLQHEGLLLCLSLSAHAQRFLGSLRAFSDRGVRVLAPFDTAGKLYAQSVNAHSVEPQEWIDYVKRALSQEKVIAVVDMSTPLTQGAFEASSVESEEIRGQLAEWAVARNIPFVTSPHALEALALALSFDANASRLVTPLKGPTLHD